MDQIQIKANVDKQDIHICRFMVDRPVHSGAVIFNSKEEAEKHELAKRLFGIPVVTKVELDNNLVVITKSNTDEWQRIGKEIGASIRRYLQPEAYQGDLVSSEIIREKVQHVLDSQINPNLASHGGYVELISVENNNIYLRMGGGCQGCGAADMTLKMGVERMIREEVPSVGMVLDVTDHASGQNPYYSPAK
ncbi:MAG: NifU family protein [Acidobacteriota bacterium]